MTIDFCAIVQNQLSDGERNSDKTVRPFNFLTLCLVQPGTVMQMLFCCGEYMRYAQESVFVIFNYFKLYRKLKTYERMVIVSIIKTNSVLKYIC